MSQLLDTITTVLDTLFLSVVAPLFTGIGQGLELLILRPLALLAVPPALQICAVAALCCLLSIWLRKRFRVDEKEAAFRTAFLAKKARQEDLKLVSDWKSRETYEKVVDEDIDQDFNTYLAARFARYGSIYLLPIFLTLFWLDTVQLTSGLVLPFPENSLGLLGVSSQALFLLCYCLFLFFYFRLRKRRMKRAGLPG